MNTNNDLTVHQVLLLRLTANQAKFYVYILIKDIVLLLLICLRAYNNVNYFQVSLVQYLFDEFNDVNML
jgi:hypothetical protein